MLHKLIATLRKRGAHGRTFPVQATEATQAAEMIADLLRQRDALLQAATQTVEENLHLADGENCTLIHIKRGIEAVQKRIKEAKCK